MLLTLGIASATYNAATIFTIIQDRYPKMPQLWISAVIAVAGFLLGLLYTTPVRSLFSHDPFLEDCGK